MGFIEDVSKEIQKQEMQEDVDWVLGFFNLIEWCAENVNTFARDPEPSFERSDHQ